jgi:type IV secretion system protein TrbJ
MKKRLISIAKATALTAFALGGLTLLFPRPAAAVFGFGDIVFDPSNYAVLGKIFTSDASLLAKTIQTYNETVRIYENGLNLYNQAKYMSLRFSQAQRMSWMMLTQAAVNDFTQNRYGETVNWPAMVNGRPELASAAWTRATVPVIHASSLSSETPGSSRLLAHLASVEAQDGSAAKCLSTIAQYRQNAATNTAAVLKLAAAQTDGSDNTNSQIEQLNLMNAAQAQANNEARSQSAVEACLVEQQILANKVQRDAVADHLSFVGQANDYAASESASWGSARAALAGYRAP